jgi:hypothetical protein
VEIPRRLRPQALDWRADTRGVDESAIGIRRQHEAVGYRQARAGQLTQVGSLATSKIDVVPTDLTELPQVAHSTPARGAWAGILQVKKWSDASPKGRS